MAWVLWDYVNKKGDNEFEEWTRKELELAQITKLNSKLNMLRTNGNFLSSQILSDTDAHHIKKLRFKAGNVAMRPMLCKGPNKKDDGDYEKEFTLLCGAKEVGDDFDPKDALERAMERREDLIKNLKTRRVPHVRVTSKSKK